MTTNSCVPTSAVGARVFTAKERPVRRAAGGFPTRQPLRRLGDWNRLGPRRRTGTVRVEGVECLLPASRSPGTETVALRERPFGRARPKLTVRG